MAGPIGAEERARVEHGIRIRFGLPAGFHESPLYPAIMDAARLDLWGLVRRQLDEIREGVDR